MDEETNLEAMDDGALEALARNGEAPEEAPDPTQADAGEPAPDAGQDAAPPAEQGKGEGWNPEGPGDPRVALQQERETSRALKAEVETTRGQVEEVKAWLANPQAVLEWALDAVERAGGEGGQGDDPGYQQPPASDPRVDALEERTQGILLTNSEKWARQALGTDEATGRSVYDVKLEALAGLREHPTLGRTVKAELSAALKSEDPAGYIVDFHDALFGLAQLDPNATSKEAAKLVAAALAKNQTPPTRGHRGIAHMSGSGQQAPAAKPPHLMTDAELEAAARPRR